jgi:hypothetical protein
MDRLRGLRRRMEGVIPLSMPFEDGRYVESTWLNGPT